MRIGCVWLGTESNGGLLRKMNTQQNSINGEEFVEKLSDAQERSLLYAVSYYR